MKPDTASRASNCRRTIIRNAWTADVFSAGRASAMTKGLHWLYLQQFIATNIHLVVKNVKALLRLTAILSGSYTVKRLAVRIRYQNRRVTCRSVDWFIGCLASAFQTLNNIFPLDSVLTCTGRTLCASWWAKVLLTSLKIDPAGYAYSKGLLSFP